MKLITNPNPVYSQSRELCVNENYEVIRSYTVWSILSVIY
jgi:hypothetical protein